MQKAVAIVPISENKKTGKVSATYVSQNSCPKTCKLFKNGCYAELGHVGIQTHRLNHSDITDPNEIAKIEADGIRTLKGDLPLRVHIVGDCTTNYAANVVGEAMKDYPNKSWTYTHAWRDISIESWSGANVLASCESTSDVLQAQKTGYATTLIVKEHATAKKYSKDNVNIIPCPEQTKGVQCVNCKLCMNTKYLIDNNLTIGFAVHGISSKKVEKVLDMNFEDMVK